jgi:predicted amidohydrolase
VSALRVAAIQHDITWEDRDSNFAHLGPLVADAAAQGAHLVVLSEMFSTGFSMHTDRVAEPEGGPSVQFLVDQALRHGIWICGSAPELAPGADRPFNQLLLVAPTGAVERYAKIHPFSYGREHEHYAAGHDFLTVAVEGVRCTFFVCYDLRFADEFWSRAPETDCYVLVANWPAARRDHWTTLLTARAIENQAYVVGVNRVGDGGKLSYAGDSMVVGPFGEVVAAADGPTEQIVVADVDAERVAAVRREFPFLVDRRPT